jgi:phosphatidylserine synthase
MPSIALISIIISSAYRLARIHQELESHDVFVGFWQPHSWG